MKIGLAQVDSTVGDFEGNVARVLDAYRRAMADQADLVLFPEMALTGYPPLDLLDRSEFVEANLRALQSFRQACVGPEACIGFVEPNPSATGKRLFNAAVLVARGAEVGRYQKALLPSYDVFDEARYFQPSFEPAVMDRPYGRIALTICEDIWNDPEVWDGRRPYTHDPLEVLAGRGVGLVVNLSASPFHIGKTMERRAVARGIVERLGCSLAYVNAAGANDALIFDGDSFVMDATGRIRGQASRFREECVVVDADLPSDKPVAPRDLRTESSEEDARDVVEALSLGIRDFCRKTGFRQVVLGLSGGIDSAVVAALAVRALGKDSVAALSMPSRHSSEGTRNDARELAANLGIRFREVPIDPICDAFRQAFSQAVDGAPLRGITDENLQARTRGVLLMAWSNQHDALVLNTGNKSEAAVGYATLYGDMVGGIAVIGDLTKEWVYRVGRALQQEGFAIPEGIFRRAPSAELRPDQRDEDSLPPYPVLDRVIDALVVRNRSGREAVAEGLPADAVAFVLSALARSEFKRRQAPFSLKVTRRAFGPGRRVPVASRFQEDLT
ncbi:MAG TPA: NAD+ synthase [Myxococcota bacterium]|nr:NAD+ synthase [Myxococcota bacterium]HQK50782.1 NAD+ synthase [Myxococcota bacterium]